MLRVRCHHGEGCGHQLEHEETSLRRGETPPVDCSVAGNEGKREDDLVAGAGLINASLGGTPMSFDRRKSDLELWQFYSSI